MSLKLYELGGTSCFSLLQEHLPPRRITYVLTFSLKQSRQSPISVHTFQNHIESILCQTDHKSVSIILLATHMDAAVHTKNNKTPNETATQKIVALLDQLEQQISAFIQVVQPDPNLRPTITGRFAVDNVNRSVLALGCQKVNTFPDLLVWLQEYAFRKIRQDDAFPQGLVPATVHALERHLSYLQKSGRVSLSTADYRHLAREVSQTYNASNNNLHKHTQLLYSSGAVVHRFRQISLRKQIFIDVKWLYEFLSVFSLCSYVAVAPSRRKLSSAEEAETGVTSNRVVLLSCPDLLKSFSAVQPLFQPDFVNQKDRLGLLTKGVLTLPVLTTLVAHFTKGKGTSCQFPDLPTILDLLESFDYIIRGSKLLFSVDSQIARKDQPVMKWETFLLVPHTFTVSPPPPVVLHFSKFLSGPFYRFHFNMVPLHFFAKLMSRLSHNPLAPAEGESENVIEKVYVGPMVVKSTPMEGPLLPVGGSRKTMAANTLMDANAAQLPSGHFSLWSSAVWVVGRGGNRAFLRMLKHALFVSFHQGQSTDPNTDLFFETILSNVRSLIMESPGASCEESLLCCRYYDSLLRLPQQGLFSGGEEDHVEDITTVGESDSMFYRTVDDNINTLEKIRAREKTALHTARSRRDSSEVGEGKEEEGDIIPLLRTRNASSPPVKATVLFDALCATTMNTVGRGAQDTIEAVVDRLNSCYQKESDADATGEVLDDLLDAFALLDANKRVTFKGTVV
ncbi:hypothetical protein AGDE_06751 [Angomonas deanei]|uniref:Uncharacterized protein n=1 Tax=Angomonas deanei TaxID=59799 RepID=A0A7G2CBJ8_9TRYP|nr:hypothetical protein AGDE_06751 [Angomonas deanei]CAD2215412.1 hypothetical protein, conserved [Angomonas deanei]|eukprot:EPY36770.1 hypothetical protein AGDE_06751 [Angomonas deanei]